ncbi:PREDICTED: ribosomal RNA processing protein 1 homolog [Ceratosolen solmsi marchali]|uniref:Ribosomal RNA processing protein 1 homolog n=1 Tax=Ceratosolen solmsi marchali TaxID=326594 RepID=A0AAJ6YN63_9HYME|nr:PREDICTED: ribosomal RNA processing protein 1 homolog [Ceratosolen solmsi marchali]
MKSKKKNTKMTVKIARKCARVLSKQNLSVIKKANKKTEINKKSTSDKALLIAQEVKFARLLANNNKKVRDKVLKNLKKWLMMRSQSSFAFTDSDFLRLWKGLFYCMWLSDKPLVQEELAESLSKIVHCFNSMDTALLYTKCTFKCFATEWFGIDRYRIDKFEMLVKRILRQTFEMCKKESWNKEWVVGVATIIEEILLDPKTCLGLNFHITEVYMEELAKISRGKIEKSIVTDFIKPFVINLTCTDDQRQIKHIVTNIFRYLIFQSDIGLDYAEKFNAWKQVGFPCKSIDEMQKVEFSDYTSNCDNADEEDSEDIKATNMPLDPRAGRVNVEIPQLPFNPTEIVSLLKEYKFHKLSTTKSRKIINQLINEFTKLSEGDMPLGIKEIPIPEHTNINSYVAAKNLLNFEQDLYVDSNKNSRKKKRKSVVVKYNENFDNIEELIVPEDVQYTSLMCSNNKKLKLANSQSQNMNHMSKDDKSIKQNNKLQLPVKKKSNKFDRSESLINNKFKKSFKTFSTCIEEYKITGADNLSANKGSTSCNWNVNPTPTSFTPTTFNKVLEKKRTTKKGIAENKVDTKLVSPSTPWLTPVLVRLEEQNKTEASVKIVPNQATVASSTKKRVQIKLHRNTVRNISEYIRQIRQNPHIPYDANRKPKASVLKPSLLPSPINPFYKRKII